MLANLLAIHVGITVGYFISYLLSLFDKGKPLPFLWIFIPEYPLFLALQDLIDEYL